MTAAVSMSGLPDLTLCLLFPFPDLHNNEFTKINSVRFKISLADYSYHVTAARQTISIISDSTIKILVFYIR